MFSLCHFQVSCDDDGGSGDDDNEGDDEEEKKEEEGLVLVDAVVFTSLGKVSYHFSSSTAYNQYPCNTYFSEIGLLKST